MNEFEKMTNKEISSQLDLFRQRHEDTKNSILIKLDEIIILEKLLDGIEKDSARALEVLRDRGIEY